MATFHSLIKVLAAVATLTATAGTVASAQDGSGPPGIVSFLSAVNSITDEIKALSAEKNTCANDIHVVDVQKLRNAGNEAVLNKAISKNSPQFATLRGALKNNPAIVAALARANVSVDEVIALDVEPGTGIHIFYQSGR
jgi:ABC-type glycerol-3-phosphate transport system substrate-binding protein